MLIVLGLLCFSLLAAYPAVSLYLLLPAPYLIPWASAGWC